MSADAAVTCPDCGHLSAVGQSHCIYCGEQLSDAAPNPPAFIANLLPPREPRPRARYVAIGPRQDSPRARAVLAAASDHDVAGARQILSRRVYTLFTFIDEDDFAISFAAALDRGMIDNVVFDQAAVDAIEPARLAAAITVTRDGRATSGHPYRASLQRSGVIHVATVSGEELNLSPARVTWACQGMLRVRRERPAENHHVMLRQHYHGEHRRKVVDTFRVLDLYGDLPGPVRLLEGVTGFTGVGVMPFEHAAGFVRFVSWLAKENPAMTIDDGFRFSAQAIASKPALDKPINLTNNWDEWSAHSWLVWRGGGAR